MKNILIAAVTVGAAIAGIILYYRNRHTPAGEVEDAANDAYNIMNDGIGKVERGTMHTME